jgi:hypothetical protein
MPDYKLPREVDMQTMLEDIVRSIMDNHHVGLPAVVNSYDATTCSISCTPTFMRIFLDENDAEVPTAYPMINDVPVVFPRGGGAFLSFPMKAGDLVYLIGCDRSLDAWKETDGKTALDPADSRRQHLSDMVAIPGPSTYKHPIPNASATDVVLGLENGSFEMHIKVSDGTMRIGTAAAAHALARADLADTRIGNLESALSEHTHVAPTFGGITTPPSNAPYSGSSTASTRVFTDA